MNKFSVLDFTIFICCFLISNISTLPQLPTIPPIPPGFPRPGAPHQSPQPGSFPQGSYAPIVQQYFDINPDGQYTFGYQSADGTNRQETGSIKYPNTPGVEPILAVQGSYSYVLPDGQQVEVQYIADENGFQPSGPGIHPSILKAVAYQIAEARNQPLGPIPSPNGPVSFSPLPGPNNGPVAFSPIQTPNGPIAYSPYPAQYSTPFPPQYNNPFPPQYSTPFPPQYSTPFPAQYSTTVPPKYSTPNPTVRTNSKK